MNTPLERKSSPAEIRQRFDADVERFANLKTGQSATMDAPLAMCLITEAAVRATRSIRHVLDIGCGAGNNTLKLRTTLGCDFDVDLIDLSLPMLERAKQRVEAINQGTVRLSQADIRDVGLAADTYDVVLAAAVLHHLRTEVEWRAVFRAVYQSLRPGGSFWITDLVNHESTAVQALMETRYADYLTTLGGVEYKDKVMAYIDREDSPRPATFQLELLREVGFSHVELLHKNACFAAFGAIRSAENL